MTTLARRVQPLARWSVVAAIGLMGAALLATAWSTRATVAAASSTVQAGQVVAIEQQVRAELAELATERPPSAAELAEILAELTPAGLRYLAVRDDGGLLAEAGIPLGPAVGPPSGLRDAAPRAVGDRLRVETRLGGRRGHGARRGSVVVEFEPLQAEALGAAATRALGIGALAALTLLAIAVVLVRRAIAAGALEAERERERRLASLGEMSAVLAHEIRNPLASLKGNAQLLAQMLPAGDKPRAKAERVVGEAIRLEALTNDLLAFVRTGELTRAAIDPGALVAATAAERAEPITVDVTAAPATWSLDGERLRQVVRNLLDNAIAAGGPVAATVTVEGGRLVIEIRDHGPGVPAEDRAHVFEPFFTRKPAGTGLGLAVARRIAVGHGGTIAVDDAPGGGARFRLELPPA